MDALDAEVVRVAGAWRARIRELPGRHVAIEALWDGDTAGWWLDVGLVTSTAKRFPWIGARSRGGCIARPLGTLRYGSDIRLFQGKVPPWPEAIVAQRAGTQVASALGLEFFFPSPDEPDDECPHWWEREGAAQCSTCGKYLVSSRAARRAAVRCHRCEREARRRQDLEADAPGSSGSGGFYCVREEAGEPARTIYLTFDPRYAAPIGELLTAVLRSRKPPTGFAADVETTFTAEEVATMRRLLDDAIDRRLGAYAPVGHFPDRATRPHAFAWRGVERTIQTSFNPAGEEIASLLSYHAVFDPAAGGRVHLFGNAGVSSRDVDVLLRARAGVCTVAALHAAFPSVPAEALERTLAKLEQRRFLVRDGDGVRLLLKGRVSEITGPPDAAS